MSAPNRARAAEARKRKRDESACLDGLVAVMETQEAADREFVNTEMQRKPHIAKILAGMIRDGRIDQAIAKAAEKTHDPDTKDLGRQLGKGCKTFKKLGVNALQALLIKIAGNDPSAKNALLNLTKVENPAGGGMTTIDSATVGEILHFALDVNDNTPLPRNYANFGYVTPLVDVLFKRYQDCGARLEMYKQVQNSKPRFWHFKPQSDTANQVEFILGTQRLALTLPLTVADVQSTTDWRIDAPHTFYATLSSAAKFLSIPLGERLEAAFPPQCTALPMKEPTEGFEYDEPLVEMPATPGGSDAASSMLSPGEPAPLAGAAVLASMPPRVT